MKICPKSAILDDVGNPQKDCYHAQPIAAIDFTRYAVNGRTSQQLRFEVVIFSFGNPIATKKRSFLSTVNRRDR